MPRHRPPLSPEEKRQILALYNSGLTGREVAARMGVSKTAVYKYLPRQGRPWKRWTEDDLQELVDGYAAGEPGDRIAARVGRSPRAVYIAMCRYRKAVRGDPKKARVMRWIRKGMSLGLKPGQAIAAVRRADILGRYEHDLQL